MIATLFLMALGGYLGFGLLFAVSLLVRGLDRVDDHARTGTWGFRLLIIPGITTLWPWLIRRWWRGTGNRPEERNAHRPIARKEQQP